MESEKPLHTPQNAITYKRRPKGHCLTCWQEIEKISLFKHKECSTILRDFVASLFEKQFPEAHVVTVSERF